MADKHPNAPRGHQVSTGWPAWRYGPNEQAAIFQTEADVPKGWADHPSKAFTPAPVEQKPAPVEPAVVDMPVDAPPVEAIERPSRRPLTLKRNG